MLHITAYAIFEQRGTLMHVHVPLFILKLHLCPLWRKAAASHQSVVTSEISHISQRSD